MANNESMIQGLMDECTSLDGRVTKLEKEAENIGQPDESTLSKLYTSYIKWKRTYLSKSFPAHACGY